MIKIENTEVFGWDAAIRGMRNPKNSWDLSDSIFGYKIFNGSAACPEDKCPRFDNQECIGCDIDMVILGEKDLKLMRTLAHAGSDHGKFLRMINVTVDLTAPLYWWKEFDTYKVGTVANSCSTMHKIAAKEFTMDDFSHEHLLTGSMFQLHRTVDLLNEAREAFLGCGNSDTDIELKKTYWWQMIQLLPSSYNQKRTVQLNYAVLLNMYHARKNHKLDEWHDLCAWIEELPYFRDICL